MTLALNISPQVLAEAHLTGPLQAQQGRRMVQELPVAPDTDSVLAAAWPILHQQQVALVARASLVFLLWSGNMINFAIVYDGKVTNIIIGESESNIKSLIPDAVVIEISNDNPFALGDYFNPNDGKFYLDVDCKKAHGYITAKSKVEQYRDNLTQLSSQYQDDISALSFAHSLVSLTDRDTQEAKQEILHSQFEFMRK